MEELNIPVVFATDDIYAPYCGVAVCSLIQNTSHGNVYAVYILYDKLSKQNISRLERLSTTNVTVKCVCISDYVKGLNLTLYGHMTAATVYRLLIPDILPQYNKVLYLDSDLVVLADVAELYYRDLNGNYIGAVRDICTYCGNVYPHNLYVQEKLGLKYTDYFNAGVLLINTKAFRENKIHQKCISLLCQRSDLACMDQDVLNLVCVGSVTFLPTAWNFMWPVSYEGVVDTQYISIGKPQIYHYASYQTKPWDKYDEPFTEYFWEYARKTPFYESILLRMTKNQIVCFQTHHWEMTGGHNRVAIYGAGRMGKLCAEKILEFKLFQLVIWVDRSYKEKQNMVFPVEPVESLYAQTFDYVIVAIKNSDIAAEIKKELVGHKISEDKIIFPFLKQSDRKEFEYG